MASRKKQTIRVAVTGFRGVPATFGGIEHVCEQLYARLAQKGYQITIYARSHYVPGNIRVYKGMRIKRLPSTDIKGLEAFLHTFLALLNIIVFEKPDIVHIHAQGPCLFAWMPRLFRPGMRVFFTCHGLDWQRRKWSKPASMLLYVGELFSVLFVKERMVVSKALQRYYKRRYGVKTQYIPNGVERPRPIDSGPISAWGVKPRTYFLFVGRIVPEKRVEDIIAAFLEKERTCKLVLVGDTAGSKEYVKKLQQKVQGRTGVIFTGFQYGAPLAALFSNARAFITASELEGMPLTLLEALSHGRVCISSEIAPHREILGSMTEFSFPVKDVRRLSLLMERVERMSDAELNRRGQKGAGMVERRFGWDRSAADVDCAYRQSLSGE